jgi:tRNA(Ile)-lysidine synthase
MLGKKKLGKYLKDEKLSLLDREKVLLLRNKNEIVWVIHHRLDKRYKVTQNTKNIIKISFI